MIFLKNTVFTLMAWATCLGFVPSRAHAQGPPAIVDSCIVPGSLHFKEMPLPGKFAPGEYEALRYCPNLGNSLLKISNAKVGKATLTHLELWMQGGKLTRSAAFTQGEKEFKKLYQTVIKESGKPSKLVDSQGRIAYHWDLGTAWDGHLTVLYDPATKSGEAILER